MTNSEPNVTRKIQVELYVFWARAHKVIAAIILLAGVFALGLGVGKIDSAITLARYADAAAAEKEKMRRGYIERLDAANRHIAELGGKAAEAAVGAAGAAGSAADAAKRSAGAAETAISADPKATQK